MTEEDVRRIVLEVLAEREAQRQEEMIRMIRALPPSIINITAPNGVK